MTRVKICGLMNQRDINLCVQAGVHMLGFVVDYPVPVPWNLEISEARALMQQVPPFVSTCMVTGGSVEKVLDLAKKIRPNVVQLHYKETLEDVKEIAHGLTLRGIKTMKALRIGPDGKCDFEITDPILAVRALTETGISAILVDSYTESRPGGTGVLVNLTSFKMIQKESSLPVVLAGGLNPGNVFSLVHELHPYAIDVLTGVEETSDKKDPNKIAEFMKNVQVAL